MALLKAYFDECGPGGKRVAAIAGFIGTEQAWKDLDGPWRQEIALFADKGVKTFHMTDCLAQQGEFARLEKPFVNRIITALTELLGKSNLTTISSAVVLEDWDRAVTDPEFLKRFPKPLDLCFDDLLRQLAEWAVRYARGERVDPVFAHHPEHTARWSEIGRVYSAEDWYRALLNPIAFDHPKKSLGLQAADLLVHQINGDIEARRYEPPRGSTIALENATGGRFTHGHWFDAEGLKLTIERFAKTGEIYSIAR